MEAWVYLGLSLGCGCSLIMNVAYVAYRWLIRSGPEFVGHVVASILCLGVFVLPAGAEERKSSPRLLRQPYLQKGTAHSMGIAWMIDDERPCSVHYGATRELGQVVESPQMQRRHFVDITGLQPDERYYYRIRSGDTWLTPDDPSYYLRPHASNPARPFSFVVLGDSGWPESGDQCPVADLLLALRPKPDFIIHTGDLSQRWALDEGEYDLLVFNVYREIFRNTPFYPTQGNHDWVTNWEHSLDPLYPRYFPPGRLNSRMTERFDMPFWRVFHSPRDNEHGDVAPFSFRYGNAVFVCRGGARTSEAATVLAKLRFTEGNDRWRFFYSHYFGMAGYDGADKRWDPHPPKCDMTFRGHVHVYSRSAPYGGDHTVDMLVGSSGSQITKNYFAHLVSAENPHALRPGITDWNEKCPHLVQVLIDGPRLTMKSYYPDGIVFDWLRIDKSTGTKQFTAMPLEDHPVHPRWQRGLTPRMRQLWIDENPKWKSSGVGQWRYVGEPELERLDAPIEQRTSYIEPEFVVAEQSSHAAPANLDAARQALEQLTSIHYRLGRHVWDDENYGFFERRFRHLFGDGDVQLDHLRQLAGDDSLPIKQRLGAVGGMGVLAHQSPAARQALVKLSQGANINFVFSACIIRACWLGEQAGLDDLMDWMKRELELDPPSPQFKLDDPRSYGNPIYVLHRFTFPYLFGLDDREDWEKKPTITYWIEFYAANRERLKFVPELRRYEVNDE